MKQQVSERFDFEFGPPSRNLSKVRSWNVAPNLGVVLQLDGPKTKESAVVWIPYPPEGQTVPEIALEYAGESGRHSNTYPSPGLGKGLPALKLTIHSAQELEGTIEYIRALNTAMPLPEVKASDLMPEKTALADGTLMPRAEAMKPRREAIPRAVQREVWQRDGGKCVECATREKLCFDHIIPFSRGGSNAIRNLQLLCEGCNLSKGNRL